MFFRFPEIIRELENKPRDDNYFESNIWPDKKGLLWKKKFAFIINFEFYRKHELQQLRIWIKSLPTYSMTLTDAAWEVLDAPVINEIEKTVKSFYTVRLFLFEYIVIFLWFVETISKKSN